MEAKCFHGENEHVYSARVLKNYDCQHLNNMSVICKDLPRKAGKVLEKYIPFNIKNRVTPASAKMEPNALLHGSELTILFHTEREAITHQDSNNYYRVWELSPLRFD